MMENNNVATLSDKNGRHDIECEVNKGDKIRDYVEMRVKDDDGEWIKSQICIKDLYGLVFMLVGEKEQQEMMPVRKTDIRVYERQHRIKLSRDMRKGEIVVANCKVSVPTRIEENIRALTGVKPRGGILLPYRLK